MRYIGFLFPLLFLSCTPEHSTGEYDAKVTVTADANTDGGVIDQDGSINDAWFENAVPPDANIADTEVIADAFLNDTGAVADATSMDNFLVDVGVVADAGDLSDAAVAFDTDTQPNPNCEWDGGSTANLSSTSDDNPPAGIVAANNSTQTLANFNLKGNGESFTACSLTIELCASQSLDQNHECPDPPEVQVAYAQIIPYITIVYASQTSGQQTASAYLIGNRAVFVNQDFFVPGNRYANLRVQGLLGAIEGTALGGEIIRAHLRLSDEHLLLVGNESGGRLVLSPSDNYLSGNPLVRRKTRIFLARDGAFPLSETPGEIQILRYRLSADPAGSAKLFGQLFWVDATDMSSSGWSLCDNLGQAQSWRLTEGEGTETAISEAGDWSFFSDYGAPCTPGLPLRYAWFDLRQGDNTTEISVDAGEEKLLHLYVDASAAGTDPSDVLILTQVTEQTADDITGSASDFASLLWSDGVAEEIDGQYILENSFSRDVTFR